MTSSSSPLPAGVPADTQLNMVQWATVLQCMEACAISTCNLICVWMLAFVSASVFGLEEVAAKALAAGKKGMMGLSGEGGESLVAGMKIG